VPDQPEVPTLTLSGETLTISWVKPNNNGDAVSRYDVLVRTNDGVTFNQSLANCDGSSAIVLGEASCDIPATAFNEAPFNLPWGSELFAKIVAVNSKGSSSESDVSSGAFLYRRPDKPLNVLENLSERTISTLGFSWTPGAENGGLPVEDYRIHVQKTEQ
jgi:hypothetical protein